jgi:hypothetical protein
MVQRIVGVVAAYKAALRAKFIHDFRVVEDFKRNGGFPHAPRSIQRDRCGSFGKTQEVLDNKFAAEEMCGGFRKGWK